MSDIIDIETGVVGNKNVLKVFSLISEKNEDRDNGHSIPTWKSRGD